MPSAVTKINGLHGTVAVHHWTAVEPRLVVLLSHGYAEHAARYEHLAQRLVAAGAAVYAPDHAGHGLSDGGRAHVELLEDMVTDLGTVAEQAAAEHPGLPVALVGHSMGGIIAARYVQRAVGAPDALVLSGPVVGGNPAIFALLDMDPMPEIPLDPAGLARDPAVGEAYAADPLIYHGAFRRESLQAFKDAAAAIAAGPSLGALPTLWLHGENDPLAPLDATTAAFEHLGGTALQKKVYPGAMHEIFNETNREEVVDDVVGFLDAQLRLGPISRRR